MAGTAALASHARSELGPLPGAPRCGQWGLVCALGRRCCGLTGRGGRQGGLTGRCGTEQALDYRWTRDGDDGHQISALGWQWPVGLEVGRQVAGEGCT